MTESDSTALCFCGKPRTYHRTTNTYSKTCKEHVGRTACSDCGAMIWNGSTICVVCRIKRKVALAANVTCDHTCELCGKTFRRRVGNRNAAKYCSRACAFADKGHVKSRVFPPSKVPPKFCIVYFPTCACCGRVFLSRQKLAKTCSDACRKSYACTTARLNSMSRTIRSERECKECGKLFVPHYGSKLRGFCSRLCGKRHGARITKSARKARIRGASEYENVNPLKVFERDGWTCKRCGISTPRSKRGTIANNAPELDHIHPVSKGGAHTYANTQCLCRKCNREKSDTIINGEPSWQDEGRSLQC